MNRAMTLSALAALALAAGCGKDSPSAAAPAEPVATSPAVRAEPMVFRIDGMRRVNGAL